MVRMTQQPRLAMRLTRGGLAATIAALLVGPPMLDPAVRPVAHAGPSDPQFVEGAGQVTRQGPNTIVDTQTARTIINWRGGMDVGPQEALRFNQPDAASRVLNRIDIGDPTRIQGQLSSNGQVYIVNPAGVYFGSGAMVDVAGLYAGAAQLSDRDFMQGVDRFTDASGPVLNFGRINAELVALVGDRVANYGTIHAPNGFVAMAAGRDVLIGERDGQLMVRVEGANEADADPAIDPSTGEPTAAVENQGTIDAEGGRVVWGAGDMYAMAVRQGDAGAVRAESVEVDGRGQAVDLAGRIDVSDQTTGARGGDVTVTGRRIAVRGTIDASGAAGGGSIRIGGDFRGTGDLARAEMTWIDEGATLLANALGAGAGGRVIVWADGRTHFHGRIEARGIAGGAGGLVETSGKAALAVTGRVDAGQGGRWLLDPTTARIVAPADNPETATLPVLFGDPDQATDGEPDDLTIDVTAINGAGAGTTVVVQAELDVLIEEAVNIASDADFVAQAGRNVEVLADMTLNNGNLHLEADSPHAGEGAADGIGSVRIGASGNPVDVDTGTGNTTLIGANFVLLADGDAQSNDDSSLTTADLALMLSQTDRLLIVGNQASQQQPAQYSVNELARTTINGVFRAGEATTAGTDGEGAAAQNLIADSVRLDNVGVGDATVEVRAINDLLLGLVTTTDTITATTTDGSILRPTTNPAPLVAGEVTLSAVNGGIGDETRRLTTDTDLLRLDVGADGAFIEEAGGVTLGDGVGNLNAINGGGIDILAGSTAAGDLLLSANAVTTDGGDVALENEAGAILDDADVTTANITTTGAVALTAAGDLGVDAAATNPAIVVADATDLTVETDGSFNLAGAGQTLDSLTLNLSPENVTATYTVDAATFAGLDTLDITDGGSDLVINDLVFSGGTGFDFDLTSSGSLLLVLAVDVAAADPDRTLALTNQNGILRVSEIDFGGGAIELTAESGGGLGSIDPFGAGPHLTTTGRVTLIADGEIGEAAASESLIIEQATTIEATARRDIRIDHDDVTDLEALTLIVNPTQFDPGAGDRFPVYQLTNFASDTVDIQAVELNNNDHLLIDNVSTTSAATDFTIETTSGNIYVDDSGAADPGASPIAGDLGDGGVDAGDGDVTLTARAGSIFEEEQRDAGNVVAGAASTVALQANTSRDVAVPGSIGGDSTASSFEVFNATDIQLSATGNLSVRGNGQDLGAIDLAVDPAAPALPDQAAYILQNFNRLQELNLETNKGVAGVSVPDLFVQTVEVDGLDVNLTAISGDMFVRDIDSNGGDIALTTLGEASGSGDGDLFIDDDSVTAGHGIDAGGGDVTLNTARGIDERFAPDVDRDSEAINIRDVNLLTIVAEGAIGGDPDPDDPDNLNNSSEDLLDIEAVRLDAEIVGTNAAANQTLDLRIKNHHASGLIIDRGIARDGFVRIDSEHGIQIADEALFADAVDAGGSTGSNFVWLVSGTDITELTPGPTVNATARGANVRFDAQTGVGTAADPIDVDAEGLLAVVGREGFGFDGETAGGLFINSLEGENEADLVLGAVSVFDGDITVSSPTRLELRNDFPTISSALFAEGEGRTVDLNAGEDIVLALQGTEFFFQNFQFAGSQALGGQAVDVAGTLNLNAPLIQAGLFRVVPLPQFGPNTETRRVFSNAEIIAGDVNFNGTVESFDPAEAVTPFGQPLGANAATLVVQSDEGTIRFTDTIGAAQPLFVFQTSGVDSTTRFAGDVITAGVQLYGGAVVIEDSIAMTDTGTGSNSGIFFNQTLDSLDGTQDLTLQVATNPDGGFSSATNLPLISFGGDVGGTTPLRSLALNDVSGDDARPILPVIATIAVADRDPATGDFIGDEQDFVLRVNEGLVMGPQEKLTAIGSLTIEANLAGDAPGAHTLRLADINTTEQLILNANQSDLELQTRPETPGGLLLPTGILVTDPGLTFWARTALQFNDLNNVTTTGGGVDPQFFLETDGQLAGIAALGFPVERVNLFPVARSGGTFFDLAAINETFPLATVLVDEQTADAPPPPPDAALAVRDLEASPARAGEMQLNVRANPAADLERVLAGSTMYVDAFDGSAATSAQRIPAAASMQLLAVYRGLFYTQATDPTGRPTLEPRFGLLRTSLTEGLAAYERGVGRPPRDPAMFRSFLEQTGEADAALGVINGLRRLFRELRYLGLTDEELDRAFRAIAAQVTPENIETAWLIDAVLARTPDLGRRYHTPYLPFR